MDDSGETASMTAEEDHKVQYLTLGEDLELALARMTVEGKLTSCQCLQIVTADLYCEEHLKP